MLIDQPQPQQQPASNPSVNFTPSQIVVQIGERYFGVSRETLQRHRTSLFGSVLQQVEQAQRGGQSGGVVSISRSPVHFPVILNYLNNGLEGLARLRLNEADLQMLEELLVEAEFYRLPELSAFVKVLLKPELNREVVQHLLKRPTAPRDFSKARLIGLDLSNLDFVNIEIKGKESRYLPTTIHRCEFKPQFEQANLQWVNFTSCNLQGANFRGARLAFTNLTDANLSSACFEGALLSKTLLAGALLTGLSFQKVHLSEVDFTGAKLAEVNFEDVDVSAQASPASASTPSLNLPLPSPSPSSTSSSFSSSSRLPPPPSPTSFPGASSNATPLVGTQSSPGCSFERARFERANLARARFSGCQMREARFEGCNLTEADFSGSNLEGCEFLDCNFSQATLAHCNLKGARLIRCNLTSALLNHANLTFTQLFSSDFSQAQLVAANLQCAELFEFSLDEAERELIYKNHPTFRGASFRFALLQGVDFHRVDCSGADFRDANLTNAIMKETKMDNANLEGAVLKRRIVEDFEAEWVVTKKGKTMEDAKVR